MERESNDSIQRLQPSFTGTKEPSPVDSNHMLKQYPEWKRRLWQLFSFITTVLFLAIIVICVSHMYYMQPFLESGRHGKFAAENAATIVSVAIAVQIFVFNTVWRPLATWLTYLENWRTMDQHSNAMIFKVFAVQFINTFNSFFYLAFFQRNRGNGCPDDDCIPVLHNRLVETYATSAVLLICNALVPYAKLRWAMYSEQRTLTAESSEDEACKLTLTYLEEQSKMPHYTQEEEVADVLDMVMALGYLFLFGAQAPLLCPFCLMLFLLYLRVIAWKLCVVYRRPYPSIEHGIGSWDTVILWMSWIGVTTTVAIPLVNERAFDKWDPLQKLALFFIVERAIIIVRFVLTSIIPEKPTDVVLMQASREHVLAKLYKNKEHDKPFSDLLTAETVDPTNIVKLGSSDAEWNTLEMAPIQQLRGRGSALTEAENERLSMPVDMPDYTML